MIIVVGGGIVGLVAALALARTQIPITLIESQAPKLDWQRDSVDPRVSAINTASQQILLHLEIWEPLVQSLPEAVAPLRRLQVWDYAGGGEINFDSAEIGAAQLGFIVENRALVKVLWEKVNTVKNITVLCPQQPVQLLPGPSGVQLLLNDTTLLSAELMIGADGPQSWVREAMGVAVQEQPYYQQALIAVARTVKPHQDTGWQNFLPTGPLGALPLADPHTVALVWSNELKEAQRLLGLQRSDFNYELSAALGHRLGEMSCVTDPVAIPLIMRHAQNYIAERIALVGDAAHVIHPLAGQGVNLGLMDAAVLAQVITQAQQKRQNIGSLRTLRRYQRWRKGDNTLMLTAMSGFKELFGAAAPWMVQLRSQGLNLVNHLPFAKRMLMRYAMGQLGESVPLS